MNISKFIDEYASKKKYSGLLCDTKTVHNLISGDAKYSFKSQPNYTDSYELDRCIEESVRSYTRDKDMAIDIYKHFIIFLEGRGVNVDEAKHCFPPISISNSFERLMFISKYLQDPNNKVSDLSKVLWVSEKTISKDLAKLRGKDNDPIQVCNNKFIINDIELQKDVVYYPSTAHPLFLTPNLTQVLVTLKGLKKMSDDPLYKEYAILMATNIWEQLSEYAKKRIHFVLSDLLPEDLTWYKNLKMNDNSSFYSEYRCSTTGNVFLDCIKNNKSFCVEYETNDGIFLFKDCTFVSGSMGERSFEVICNQGNVILHFDKILRSAYTIEELI